jgi:hypothetical protein
MAPDLVSRVGKGEGNSGESQDRPSTEESEISIAAGNRSHIKKQQPHAMEETLTRIKPRRKGGKPWLRKDCF